MFIVSNVTFLKVKIIFLEHQKAVSVTLSPVRTMNLVSILSFLRLLTLPFSIEGVKLHINPPEPCRKQ